MSKHNKTTLRKMESIFEQLAYKVRYEKGNFQSGYCIVEDQQIVVINKFFDTEGRVQTMLEILWRMDIDIDRLTVESQKFIKHIFRTNFA